MRASTLFFLALFAAMVWSGHFRNRVARGLHRVCDAMPACSPAYASDAPSRSQRDDPRLAARVGAVENEIAGLGERGRDVERSLQSIAQSERTLRDLVRRHPDRAVARELHEIEAGEQRLRELKDEVETRRVVLQARLQLVRAGLDVDVDRDDESATPPAPSPVDALSTAALPVRD
jgi:hypothetical protein